MLHVWKRINQDNGASDNRIRNNFLKSDDNATNNRITDNQRMTKQTLFSKPEELDTQACSIFCPLSLKHQFSTKYTKINRAKLNMT